MRNQTGVPCGILWVLVALLVTISAIPALGAADKPDEQKQGRGGKPEVEPGKFFSPFPVKDYTGGGTWLTWANATGDWGGLRNQLAKDGITFEVDTLQIFQGNTHGGADTTNAWRYSGSAEYTFRLDTGRAGLWPGGRITVRGRTRFGHGVGGKVGSPVNYDALLPISGDECKTVLSEFYIEQGLSPKLILIAGKLDGARFADRNEFASDEKTQFLHVGFRANPVVLPHAPYTNLAAALIYLPIDWLSIGTFVWDTNGSASKTGFDTAFHQPEGMSLAQEWGVKVKPFGLKGEQKFGWVYSTKNFTVLDQGRSSFRLTPEGVVFTPEKRPDDWVLYYNFHQYLYTEPDDPEQGVGIFGRFGWSTAESNPFEEFYSIGVGGKGIIPGRDNDRFGIGYFHLNFSDDFPRIVKRALGGLDASDGIELFYNIEITPWLHITPDLQIICNPGANDNNDTAIVAGVRVRTQF